MKTADPHGYDLFDARLTRCDVLRIGRSPRRRPAGVDHRLTARPGWPWVCPDSAGSFAACQSACALPRPRGVFHFTQSRFLPELNQVSGVIINAGFRIAEKLGPGLLESVYERILARDLRRQGLRVDRQKPISFDFEGMWFEDAFKVDLLVERCIVVEIKSVPRLAAAHHKQLLTYLRLLDCRLGLLLNFGAPLFKDGIKRIANNL